MPTLTVGLPVYNNADDLRRSIPSVMNQTWKEGELRLLVVDDGSTDETPQVLEEYCRIYSNITVVRNATNQGRAQARNRILDLADGDYLAWIDADDEWFPDKIEKQFRVLRARADDRGVLCSCSYELRWVDDGRTEHRRPRVKGDQLKNFLDGSLYPYLWTMLGRTETFRQVGRFEERLRRRQDYEFLLRFLSAGGEIVSTDPAIPLCRYNRTDKGRSGWDVAAANRWIWKKHRSVFARYRRLYALERRALQHGITARFFGNNHEYLPWLIYSFRRWLVERRIAWHRWRKGGARQEQPHDPAALKEKIFGRGLSVPPAPVKVGDHQVLEQEYLEKGLDRVPDTFVLTRIIGNDLEPRHARGQAYSNLKFILENEPPLADCEKRWIVNRIYDPEEEARIIGLLEQHGQPYLRVPFDAEAYRTVGLDFSPFPQAGVFWRSDYHRLGVGDMRRILMTVFRKKNAYVMHNNGARNMALEDGRKRAKWILPWDGACFLTESAWQQIRHRVIERPEYKYVMVPMARVTDNHALLSDSIAVKADEEPQVIFRRDASETFNELWPYGRRPKMELLWRLGVAWKHEHWKNQPWDPELPGHSPEAGQYQFAGWVARLFSGRGELEAGDQKAFLKRGIARENAILTTLEKLDANVLQLASGPLVFDRERFAAQRQLPAARPLLEALERAAESALLRPPPSVVDKGASPVGDLNDYFHPAPYWWPNPETLNGLPYVRRAGERQPGTRLFEEGSERYDRTRLQQLCDDVYVLALALEHSGEGAAADHAAAALRRWFIDEPMSPHLRYAESVLGHNHDCGSGRGIIQAHAFWYLLEAVRILDAREALEPALRAGLQDWFSRYLDWLLESRQGRWAKAALDFHGVYYEQQVLAVAAWLGERQAVVQSLYRCEEKAHFQLRGSAGLGRTPDRVCFTLQGWANLRQISRGMGKDFFEVAPAGWEVRSAIDEFLSQPPGELDRARLQPLAAACARESDDAEAFLEQSGPGVLEGARPFWMLG